MNKCRWLFFIGLASLLFLTIASSSKADTIPYPGLWVGTATIEYVSEVNRREPDLSFDLELNGLKAEETFIQAGDTWRYNDTGYDLGNSWYDPSFNDTGSGWSAGQAPLGYPYMVGPADHQVKTTISYGGNSINKYLTTYFRKKFSVDDPSLYTAFKIRVWRDDAIAIYLNGQEILRNNLSTSYLDYLSPAFSEMKDYPYLEITLPATLLRPGDNCLAVEVHLAIEDDDDLLFDLELTGLLEKPESTEFIPLEASGWQYYDLPAAAPASNWYSPSYNPSNWLTGQAQFGYGEGDEKTEVGLGSSQKPATIYFRKTFGAGDSAYTHLKLMLLADDGAVVYLNGIEILRTNMPSGTINYDTPPVRCIGSSDEKRYLVSEIDLQDKQGLLKNDNLLAVEIHQHPGELDNTPGNTQAQALTRTPASLDLRFLLHVDSTGVVRLLKEAIQMYDQKKKEYVILTNHSLIPNYSGVALRDGEQIGRRLSAVGFDFDPSSITCTGAISPTGSLSCEFTLSKDHPTNPFLHRYHPDHDNLDPRYEKEVEEAYTITRKITLQFDDRYPPNEDEPEWTKKPPQWGDSMLGGIYTEKLSGLHKDDITVSGAFTLHRVSDTTELK